MTRALLPALLALLSPVTADAADTWHAAHQHDAFVLFKQGTSSLSMNGSEEDVIRARGLRQGQEPMLYFRRDGAAWVVRDAATLRRADAIFAPQQAMGARQAALGSRQAALGRQQAALGTEQARLGRMQVNATPGRATELGRMQRELGARQNALGEQQNGLGREQSALGREQARLSREADVQFQALTAEILQRGVAQRVD